jgi:hypothetical protein
LVLGKEDTSNVKGRGRRFVYHGVQLVLGGYLS